MFNPCSPAKAPNLADLCNPISRQTIELESYPKPSTDSASLEVKIEKKTFFVLGGGFLEVASRRGHVLEILATLAGPGPQPIDPLFWLKVYLKLDKKQHL